MAAQTISNKIEVVQYDLFSEAKVIQIKEPPQPQWDKFYSVYAFDEIKYHKLLAEYFKEHNKLGIYDLTNREIGVIRKQCYALDKEKQKQHLGDEKHIYRYAILNKIQTELSKYLEYSISKKNYTDLNNGLIMWKESYEVKNKIVNYYQIEIIGTENLSLKERVIKHLTLLRLLRNKVPVTEAVKLCR